MKHFSVLFLFSKNGRQGKSKEQNQFAAIINFKKTAIP